MKFTCSKVVVPRNQGNHDFHTHRNTVPSGEKAIRAKVKSIRLGEGHRCEARMEGFTLYKQRHNNADNIKCSN